MRAVPHGCPAAGQEGGGEAGQAGRVGVELWGCKRSGRGDLLRGLAAALARIFSSRAPGRLWRSARIGQPARPPARTPLPPSGAPSRAGATRSAQTWPAHQSRAVLVILQTAIPQTQRTSRHGQLQGTGRKKGPHATFVKRAQQGPASSPQPEHACSESSVMRLETKAASSRRLAYTRPRACRRIHSERFSRTAQQERRGGGTRT